MNKIKKNNSGSALLVISMLVLTFILIVALGASAIVRNGIIVGREQMEATRAFFAAEGGAERILWEIWQGGLDPGTGSSGDFCDSSPSNFCFLADPGVINGCAGSCVNKFQTLTSNGSIYSLEFSYDVGPPSETTLSSSGSFKDVGRVIKLIY